MKKIILLIFLWITILNASASAYTAECNIINKNADSLYQFDYRGITLSGRDGRINNILWTGKEYLYYDTVSCKLMSSNDMKTWNEIPEENGVYESTRYWFDNYEISFWGDKYIVYNKKAANAADIIQCLEHGMDVSNNIEILDEKFNIIGKTDFKDPITNIGYLNGKYYCLTQNFEATQKTGELPDNIIYVSDDALVWNIDPALQNIPIGDGVTAKIAYSEIMTGKWAYGYLRKIGKFIPDNNIYQMIDLKTEEILKDCQPIDRGYISYNSADGINISMDGVYWVNMQCEELMNCGSINQILVVKDKILCVSDNSLFEYDIKDLYCRWDRTVGVPIYVQLKGEILAFAQHPVIEEGRTLVPMRFLFEQMGADVTWNDETQTATAILDNNTVTFAVNDTEAEVNSHPVTMDVPARLINGRTMVPLRFLSEELGYTVTWDDESRTAVIE